MSIPVQYLLGLEPKAKREQEKAILTSRKEYEKTGKISDRPKVSDTPTPRSRHAAKFEKKYGFSIADTAKVKSAFPDVDVDTILSKGRAAYASSGSRPNVSIAQWANARLASVLTGGAALKVDKSHVGPAGLAKIKA
jgi:hypothetical protein